MSEWNFSDFASKDNLLRTVREQSDQMLALASAPGAWEAPTAVGPLAGARHHRPPRRHHRGLLRRVRRRAQRRRTAAGSARRAGHERARRRGRARVPGHVRRTSCWPGSRRTGPRCSRSSRASTPSVGRLPRPAQVHGSAAGVLLPGRPARRLHGAHLGHPPGRRAGSHALDGDAADLLVPFCFIVWQSTADCADVEPFSLGVRLTGNNGGDTGCRSAPEGVALEPGDLERPAAGARVRRRQLRAHRDGPHQRRHRPRRRRAWPSASATSSSGSEPDSSRSRSDARSAPARSARSFSHTSDGATSPMPAEVSKPQSVPAMTRRGSPTAAATRVEPVGDDLGVLDVVARRVDHPGDEHHAVGQRPALEAAVPRGRGGRWPSRSRARRRAPRRAAAGSRRAATSWVCGPS